MRGFVLAGAGGEAEESAAEEEWFDGNHGRGGEQG